MKPDPAAAWIEAVWDSVLGTPNAPGWRTQGTVTTIYATAPGGHASLVSTAGALEDAQQGVVSVVTGNLIQVGQEVTGTPDYVVRQGFVDFETGALNDTDEVSAVVLSLHGFTNLSTTDFTAAVAVYDYGGGVPTAGVAPDPGDFRGYAVLSGMLVLATWESSGYSAGYNVFTSESAFAAAISLSGDTRLVVFSTDQPNQIAPTDVARVSFDDADEAGTTSDPKLDITHARAVVPVIGGMPRRMLNSTRMRPPSGGMVRPLSGSIRRL